MEGNLDSEVGEILPVESGIREILLLESSTNKDWNLIPGIRNPWRRNHNPRLSWISLHGARQLLFLLRNKVYILRLELSKKTKYRITFLLETYSHSVG